MNRVVRGAVSGVALGAALVVRTTLRMPLAGVDAQAPHRLLTSTPHLAALLVAVLLFGALGAALGRIRKDHLVTPFLASGLAVAIFVPGAFAVAPFLAAFWGNFLDVVLLVGLVLSVGRAWEESSIRPASMRPRTIWLCAFVLYLFAGLEISRDVGLTGDEPHYLLVTESLLKDGDIRVQNNYANEDYRSFYAGKIGPHLAAGSPYSVHGVLLSLLLLPGFALAGLTGVVVTEAVLAACLVQTVYRTAAELTGSASRALVAAAGFGLTAPGLFLGVSAYPEVPAALVVALIARRCLSPDPPRPAAAFGWSVLIGSLPFLHVKFVPLSALLIAALVFRYRRKRSALSGLAAGTVVSVAALLLFALATMGSLDPTAAYGHQRIFLDRVPLGVAGLLFDQEFGLLTNAPIYLLGIVGLSSLVHRDRLLGGLSILALLAVLVPGAAHPLWTGGSSPPARFLFPALPLLMVAAATLSARKEESGGGVGVWSGCLLATSLVIAGAMFFLPGQPLYLNGRDGTGRIWEALSSSWDLTDYLPSLVRADARSIVWGAVLAALLFALALFEWGPKRLRPRLPSAGWCVLAALWIQDLTGVSHSRAQDSRWILDAMHRVFAHRDDRFLELPAFSRVAAKDVPGRLALRLETDAEDGDPRHWWSVAYALPAGRFRIEGVSPAGEAVCNGEGAVSISAGRLEFRSRVELARFRLRARELTGAPVLVLVAPGSSSIVALRTAALPDGSRLHGLDDGAYLDPSGFWVKASSSARFALESPPSSSSSSPSPSSFLLRLANGGAANRVIVTTASRTATFALAPWERTNLAVGGEGDVRVFTVESTEGFRPSDLDPSSHDARMLGVRIEAGAAEAPGPGL